MIVLKIIGIVVAVLVVLLLLFLALPVDVFFRFEPQKGLGVFVRILGIPLGGGSPDAEKPKKENPKSGGGAARLIKRLLGFPHLESGETLRSALEEQGAAETLSSTLETVQMLLDRVFWLVRRCKVIRCKFISVSGGEDAALEYGTACAILYPFISYLQSAADIATRVIDLRITWDFDREDSLFEMDLGVRVHIWHLARVLVHIIMKNLEKEV